MNSAPIVWSQAKDLLSLAATRKQTLPSQHRLLARITLTELNDFGR